MEKSNFLKKLEEQKMQNNQDSSDEEMDEESSNFVSDLSKPDQMMQLPKKEISNQDYVPIQHKFNIPKPSSFSGGQLNTSNWATPLSWDEFFDRREKIDSEIPVYFAGKNEGHVVFCMHGAGLTAMSFAPLAKYLKNQFTVVSFDWRGHGSNTQADPTNLDENVLVQDTMRVLRHVHQIYPKQSIVMVGHSMGGSIATKVMHYIRTEHKDDMLAKQLQALMVIDVVEGSAMDALPFMETFIHNRPKEFKTMTEVIQYGFQTDQVREKESARVTMPAQVKAEKIDDNNSKLVWKTDLLASKPYWNGWFKGLSSCFLGISCPKQLLLANADRMDKELTIAQMQGKFKLMVIPDVGHAIQEDNPMRTAVVLQEFITKFKVPKLYQNQMVVIGPGGKKVVINN